MTIFYAPVYMSVWKSTRDLNAPSMTPIFDEQQKALLWFDRNPSKSRVRRTPVILVLPATTLTTGFGKVLKWTRALDRILPDAGDILRAVTENKIIGNLIVGVDMARRTALVAGSNGTATLQPLTDTVLVACTVDASGVTWSLK